MKIKYQQLIGHMLLCIFLFLLLFPILFAISNSFKTMQESVNHIFSMIPRSPTVENYAYVAQRVPIFRIIFNTLTVATFVTLFKLVTSIFCAYGIVYFHFKGKYGIYFFMLSTMFIPFTVTMIPNYLTISKIHLSDTLIGVILPQFADVLGIFLLRQAMRGIPGALIEAAKIDGVGDIKILKDIILPLIRPAVLSTGIIFFINSWNEYVWPVLILKTKENFTLSLALQMFISSEGGTEFPVAMSVSVITMVIPLLLYCIFQKYIINTFMNSGMK